ncbi:MAG: class I SAM-dependent methyltransferase, partial [Pirellulaceae bacterium]
MLRTMALRMLAGALVLAVVFSPAFGQTPAAKSKKRSKEDHAQREKSLKAIASHLQVGAGAVIADIGAGSGSDTWVFADIVGPMGKVVSEEIDEGKVASIKEGATQKKLTQVEAVLGTTSDPALPANSVNMAFMHFVYHHVTQPREVLRGIWKGLKPGGYLVVVDQRLGTLIDWVPRADRGPKHFWIAETTVVREAREEGFHFVEFLDAKWHAKESFVLVFQRPRDLEEPGSDPDVAPPVPAQAIEFLTAPGNREVRRVAFVALGEGRKLVAPVLQATRAEAIDIVLEEWATQKDERPPAVPGVNLPALLTDRGDPHLPADRLDAVYFLDTYHLLFHGPTLLKHLRERLSPTGRIYVLDR